MNEERDFIVLARRRFDSGKGAFAWVGEGNSAVHLVRATDGGDAVDQVTPHAGWDYWAVPMDTQDAYRAEAGVVVDHVLEFGS